VDQQIFGPSWI